MKNSDIARSGILIVATVAGGTVVTFLTHILVSRTLGVSGYGEYAVLVAWAMLLSLPASLGADGTIVKYVPGFMVDERRHAARQLIVGSLCLQLIAMAVIGAILIAARQAGLVALEWAHGANLVVVMLLMVGTVGSNTLIAALQAIHRAVTSQIIGQLVRPLLGLLLAGLIVAAAATLPTPSMFVASAAAASLAVLATMAVVILRLYPRGAADARRLDSRAELARFGSSILMAAVAQQALVQLPVLLVDNLSTSAEAGLYGVASRLAVVVSLGMSALSTVSISAFAKAFHESDHQQVRRILKHNAWLAFAYASLTGAAMWLVAPLILPLFGAGFDASYPALMCLVAAIVVASTMGSALAVVAMSGHPLVVASGNALGVVLIVLISFLMVPSWGAFGAAIASSAGMVAAVAVASAFAWRKLALNPTIWARPTREADC